MQRFGEVLTWPKSKQADVLQAGETAAKRLGLGLAPAEEQVDLSLCLSSSHWPVGEEVPAPCPEEGEAEQVLGPAAARETASQGTSPSHSSGSPARASASTKLQTLLCIFGRKQVLVLCTSASYTGRGWNHPEFSLEGESWLATPVNLQVFS